MSGRFSVDVLRYSRDGVLGTSGAEVTLMAPGILKVFFQPF